MQDCLPPYLPGLVPRLQQLLAQGQKLVQEGALTALASVADSTKLAFAPFYGQVISMLMCCGMAGLLEQPLLTWIHRFARERLAIWGMRRQG